VRLLEGLAQPNEEVELSLSYYNTMTTWININKLLTLFGLTRDTFFGAAGADFKSAPADTFLCYD
jgi:hypothetical protein